MSQRGNAFWTLRGAYQMLCVYCRSDKMEMCLYMKCYEIPIKQDGSKCSIICCFLFIYLVDWMHLDVKGILYCICKKYFNSTLICGFNPVCPSLTLQYYIYFVRIQSSFHEWKSWVQYKFVRKYSLMGWSNIVIFDALNCIMFRWEQK